MSTKVIEQELADLKKRLDLLEKPEAQKPKKAWRRAFGAMKGDPLLREAAHLGAEWRKHENRRK
jgi:hypothetical protein